MRIKKYIAKDFYTAIQQAKLEMGKDAIILHSRHIKKGGILGFFTKAQVEITVAIDDSLKVDSDIKREKLKIDKSQINITSETESNEELAVINSINAKDSELLEEMQKMKDIISNINNKMFDVEATRGISDPTKFYYAKLLEKNVDQNLALNILNNVEAQLPNDKRSDQKWVRKLFVKILQEHLKDYINDKDILNVSDSDKAKVIVFIGPTGVGKTTTIAKIAANTSLIDKKEVALITLDTYRISAAEQIRTFAEIIGLPIKVIFNDYEMEESINKYKDKDVILIDTAGRSPHNQAHMQELQSFINLAKPDEIILVMRVEGGSSGLINIYERFNRFGITKLIFTKLDETNKIGNLFNVIKEIKKPVVYFTMGQEVPDDIEIPDSMFFAQLLLGEDEFI